MGFETLRGPVSVSLRDSECLLTYLLGYGIRAEMSEGRGTKFLGAVGRLLTFLTAKPYSPKLNLLRSEIRYHKNHVSVHERK